MRQLRQSFSQSKRSKSSEQLSLQFTKWPLYRNAQHVAGYLAQDGELSLETVFKDCRNQNKSTYLPILRPLPPNRLWFAPFMASSPLTLNRYQIPEPEFQLDRLVAPSRLDLVLFPLVAFDADGGRLGMGGGFYDRTFAHLRYQKQRPLFVGIAYDEQRVEQSLPMDNWDIPLDAVVTPTQLFSFIDAHKKPR